MTDALPLAAIVATGALYGVGYSRLPARARRPLPAAAFCLGLGLLALAVGPPLAHAGHDNLVAHMSQHILLQVAAAPLLVAGSPTRVMAAALPRRWRRAARRTGNRLSGRGGVAWTRWIAAGIIVNAAVTFVWHVPAFYETALEYDVAHALQHASFLAGALLLWWAVAHGRRHARAGLAVLAVFVAALPGTALGALMTLATTSWYPSYSGGAHALEDQQLAGVVMWAGGNLAFVVIGAALFAAWLAALDRQAPARPAAVQS